MNICRVCSQANEDEFTYCKNCGNLLEKPRALSFRRTQVQKNELPALVPVYMNLPDIKNPSIRSLQKVYVTPEQYNAMKTAGMFLEKEEN